MWLLTRGPETFITVKQSRRAVKSWCESPCRSGSSTPPSSPVFFFHSYPYEVKPETMLLPIIAKLGAVGMGLTCGWLIARFSAPGNSVVIKSLTLAAATLITTGEVFLFSDWQGATLFLCSAALALLLRLGWYRELGKRFNSSS